MVLHSCLGFGAELRRHRRDHLLVVVGDADNVVARRHLKWVTRTCRRHVHVDPAEAQCVLVLLARAKLTGAVEVGRREVKVLSLIGKVLEVVVGLEDRVPLSSELLVTLVLALDPRHEAFADTIPDCICYSHEALPLVLHSVKDLCVDGLSDLWCDRVSRVDQVLSETFIRLCCCFDSHVISSFSGWALRPGCYGRTIRGLSTSSTHGVKLG